jgi:hypothetical protein
MKILTEFKRKLHLNGTEELIVDKNFSQATRNFQKFLEYFRIFEIKIQNKFWNSNCDYFRILGVYRNVLKILRFFKKLQET